MSKQLLIFCDFDGTVTDTDNIIEVMKHFAPPEWEPIKDAILSEQISIKNGVGQMFQLLSSNLKEEIVQFVQENAHIRPGFAELVQYVNEEQIPFYIVSGGVDFFVYPVLKNFISTASIFCNEGDFSGERIQINWPYPCDDQCQNDCGCCKPSLFRRFPSDQYEKIMIGDSITDFEASKQADHVYARDFLQQKCEELQIPYTPFTTFYDILADLQERKITT
ncbi:2-hydroxy-3-keto-5-methylthiopentenyl-1-phosphatephosphatase [Seinonella peptonophila]|uniref:2-hydroxy-3-keto-5-methylthiopentenyl-1-phosphate phosphatase n=1 Tax=Seinonella peptonophila TaxID=112248 RepID=A0A1M4Z975_9BACL|nr:2-hydroxy-3-keto-5-methylthiopentenyl-1-phosphate phosphatase [Seinonella peptonophila]SHF14367.1 2-hydroxy-3-keto-5-methylthiopentenyl-1-phosphatephosphatase [Seinonella peptonophila]